MSSTARCLLTAIISPTHPLLRRTHRSPLTAHPPALARLNTMSDQSTTSLYFDSERDKLVLQSKDGVLFRVDRQKLMSVSPAFEAILGMDLDPSKEGSDKPVAVEEEKDVLEPFLRFALWKAVPTDVTYEHVLLVIEAFEKYGVEVGSTLLCDQLYTRFVETQPAKVWSVCAKAGQEGLAKACLAYLPNSTGPQAPRYTVAPNGSLSQVVGRPFSLADVPAEDLEGVPATALLVFARSYNKVIIENQSWAVAALGRA